MKTMTIALLLGATLAFGAEANHKACMFAGTGFGAFIPAGYSSEAFMAKGPDFVKWSYTNAAGSRITFVSGVVPPQEGTKTNLAGCAALEFKDKRTRRIELDSSGVSHAELKKIGKAPRYDAVIQYEADSDEDRTRLDESVESLFLRKEGSNQVSEVTARKLAEPQD